MRYLICFLMTFCISTQLYAGNVILMIGDGMGANHLKCAEKDKPLYITSLPVKGWVQTHSANNKITDSAASATAYSCGQKTNNSFLGKLPNGENCETISEEAVKKDIAVGIYSNDGSTGATPSAFYSHVLNRFNSREIENDKKQASLTMDIVVPSRKISEEISPKLNQLSQKNGTKGFFAMFEGAKIDKRSHENRLEEMKKELYDFDYAVMKASNFVYQHPDTTLIVLADHETGGLTEDCQYTTHSHTGQDIPIHAYGKYAQLFEGLQDNTDIYKKIKQILFSEDK